MTAHHHEQKVPRGVLIGAGVLLLVTIGIAAGAKSARDAREVAPVPAVASVELRFEDRPDGAVGVLDAASGREVASIAPESNGFIRGVLRGMYRTRKLESIDRSAPLRLEEKADGRLLLSDPETGREVELRSFGRTNYQAFADLLAAGRRDR